MVNEYLHINNLKTQIIINKSCSIFIIISYYFYHDQSYLEIWSNEHKINEQRLIVMRSTIESKRLFFY